MDDYGRILVTGAAGFVGRHLLAALKARFPTAHLMAAVKPEDGLLPTLDAAETVLPFDLLDPDAFGAMVADLAPDGLIHLAAQSSVAASFADAGSTWQANLLGTVALGEAVRLHRPRCRFVLASSAEVYGLSFRTGLPLDEAALLVPANPYAASKAASDLAIGEMSLRGLRATRLRAFNHTGAGQSAAFVIAAFARQIALIEAGRQEPVLHVGQLDRWRDFLDVSDVCAAYVAALVADTEPGAVYNIASGTARRIGDILNQLLGRSHVKPVVEVAVAHLRPTDVDHVVGDMSLARRELSWAPTTAWDDTLDAVLDDWRKRVGSA
jgi:GDP-4-dehydro-6-deoxy-D-mannose reductase